MLAGIDENQSTIGKHKVKLRYFPGARLDDMYDYMKPLVRNLPNCKQMVFLIIHQGKS